MELNSTEKNPSLDSNIGTEISSSLTLAKDKKELRPILAKLAGNSQDDNKVVKTGETNKESKNLKNETEPDLEALIQSLVNLLEPIEPALEKATLIIGLHNLYSEQITKISQTIRETLKKVKK